MERYWHEEERGIFFEDLPEDSAQKEKLDMLYFEGVADISEDKYSISYENVALISDEDAELLGLPEIIPYQLSIVADGTIGYSDLHYTFQVLKPGGQSFVNPQLNGSILHIDEDTCYRLSSSQYKLICLMNESNQTVPTLSRKEISGYSLTNLGRMQRHARATKTRLDEVISESNQKIVIPEKLDIEFSDDGSGKVQIKPIILEEGTGKALDSEDERKFQEQFAKGVVKNVYSAENSDGGKIKYVCPPAIKDGLTKVKNINKKKLSKAEAERYVKQPRELLDDAVFKFRNKETEQDNTTEKKHNGWNELPEEGELISSETAEHLNEVDASNYSDRIKGTTTFKKSVYFGSGRKTDWLGMEGESENEISETQKNILQGESEKRSDENNNNLSTKDAKSDVFDWRDIGEGEQGSSGIESKSTEDNDEGTKERNSPMVLDIKPNFDTADYSRCMAKRNGFMDEDALQTGIRLYDYQEEAVDWMFTAWSKGYSGVLLADDMGLGKTLQTLAFISELKKGLGEKATKPVLIVGPTALLRNWENEYRKFISAGVFTDIISLHGSSIHEYQTGEVALNGKKKLELRLPLGCIALTTYETLRDYQFSFAEVAWGVIILDEAQKIKNPSTGITTAIKAMNYDYAIGLSGTPVENSWTDLWSIMDFLQPQLLGTLQNFREMYVNKLKDLEGDFKGIEDLGQKLKKSLNPLLMRRMKQDKLEGIPKKTVHVCKRIMPEYQRKRYIAVLEEARAEEVHPLVTIAKLRDVSLHPDICSKLPSAFYDMEPETVIGQSARLIQTFDILQQIKKQNDKALIFVVSKKMQLILRHLLKKVFGIYVEMPVNGELNGNRRQSIIDNFNKSDGFGVLILSPEAAGVGFTITSANHVIHLSRTWNPAKEDQATDRVYRIGQVKDVHVYLPLACLGDGYGPTFDENLNELLEYKRKLSDNVMFPTSDDAIDGQKVFNKSVWNQAQKPSYQNDYVTIKDVDGLSGDAFEQMITALYDRMEGKMAIKTPHSNDNGADVVVIYDDGKNGMLLQCKHKSKPSYSTGKDGVQEVFASVNYYKEMSEYKGIDFQPVVITNANDFTPGAKELAQRNGVTLIARDELKALLAENPMINTL